MKTPTQGYNLMIEVDNFNLSYDDIGEGVIPIVFLHGFPFDKTMWHKQMEFLKAAVDVAVGTTPPDQFPGFEKFVSPPAPVQLKAKTPYPGQLIVPLLTNVP